MPSYADKTVCKFCGCTDEEDCAKHTDNPGYWQKRDGLNSVCSHCQGMIAVMPKSETAAPLTPQMNVLPVEVR